MSSTEVYDAQRRLRQRWDDLARVFTAWDETGAEVEQRPYDAVETARADEAAAAGNRDKNLTDLIGRIRTEQSTVRNVAGATSFNNTQRDDALRALARVTLAQNQLLRYLLGQVDALDALE